MLLNVPFAIIITQMFWITTAKQMCNNSICNHEAVCTIKGKNPTCNCVGKFFEGDFCTKPIDHCTPNPCQNGGTCHQYLGHYHCECVTGYSAQTCSSKQDAFRGLHLHYNHVAALGERQSLVLMIQDLGTVETLMDFFTLDYIIDGVAFTSSNDRFKSSDDLKALNENLGIRHSDKLPYNSGFYRISKATFWKLGTQTMVLDLSDFGTSEENFFTEHFDILVYDPIGEQCLPIVHLPHCSNPRKTLHIDIVKFNFVEPIVDKRCALHSIFQIKWSVKNFIDTVVLHRFPGNGTSILTIPPYTMWFNYQDDYVQSYLIEGDVSEVDSKGGVISKTILRCYVFVDSKPTKAYILGGAYREVNVAKNFIIDGSISRDYARSPNHDQELEYSWSCRSRDSQNPYCSNDMGSENGLSIPAGALDLGHTYTYFLQVRSTVNIYSTHRNFQEIKGISDDSLLIHIHCLRNCEHDKFAAGKVIHLKVVCEACPPGIVAFSVQNEQGTEVANSQSVLLIEDTRKEIFLKAVANLGSLKGMASIKLTLNSPPVKGSCKISPKSGIEYQTVFKIACLGFQDDDNPINYKFSAGTTTLDHSGNNSLTTRLFRTSGDRCEIKITICDDIEACAEFQLEVKLAPIFPNGSAFKLVSNLMQLVGNGDRSNAIALIRTAIAHMPTEEDLDIAKYIVESIRNLKLERLLAVEQLSTIAKDLVKSIRLSSDSALLVSELFMKVSKGLMHCIDNGEVVEMSLNTHEQMIGELTQAMTKAATIVEEFPAVHNVETFPLDDSFSENYIDYGELDITDVVHISNWVQFFNRMLRCLEVMGAVSSFIQLPDEYPVQSKTNGITSKSLVIDNTKAVSFSWNHSETYVTLPDSFFKSLNATEVAIQVMIFEKNPFWWNPEQHNINTEVLSIGAYTKDLPPFNLISEKSSFIFFMALKSNVKEMDFICGSVNSFLDMPVYERILPPYSVLVVTFMPSESSFGILLKIGGKPRGFMLKNATIVKASKERTTLLLVNHNITEQKAFLAITSRTRTNFTFSMNIRMCLTWNPSTYDWTSKHCFVGSKTNSTHIHCTCRHLSMFAAKVYPTFGKLHQSRGILHHLTINYGMVVFYLTTILGLGLLLWLAWQKDLSSAQSLVVLNGFEMEASYKYVVTIYTNGHVYAATSSNVTLQLHGSQSDSERYTLYSVERHSSFNRNTQTSFGIYSKSSLGELQLISLNIDNFGRYPSWNCLMVKVHDEVNRKEYIFLVDKWLSDNDLTIISLTKKEDLLKRWTIFRHTITNTLQYIQVFLSFIPRGNMTAMQAAIIFIIRICITLTGTILAYGPTTVFSYEEERETYYSLLPDFGRLLLIGFRYHLLGLVTGFALQYLFIKLR